MTRNMEITVVCDGVFCDCEVYVDLDNGNPFDDAETIIDKSLKKRGWYSNLDGDYCPKCAPNAKKEWSAK